MMDINRLDEIFHIKKAVPIVGGMYIGMSEDDAGERLEELSYCKEEHSYEYPDDLIYKQQISFEYDLFEYSNLVKSVRVIFRNESTIKDFKMARDYMAEKFYHEEVLEETVTDWDCNKVNGSVVLKNSFYEYSLFNKEGKFIIQVSATSNDPTLYRSFYLVATNTSLFEFIKKSITFCYNGPSKNKYINELMEMNNGFPVFCNTYLGSNECFERDIDDYLENIGFKSYISDFSNISYEIMEGWNLHIEQIFIRIPDSDFDHILNMFQFIKNRFLVESASYDIQYNKEGKLSKLDAKIENEFISVKLHRFPLNSDDLELAIEVVEQDNEFIYEALYNMLYKDSNFRYFEFAKAFYKDKSDTQDGRFNGLRVKYKSFKEALDEYIGPKIDYARDMGGYSDENYKRDREIIIDIWNRPGVDDRLPMSWVNVG